MHILSTWDVTQAPQWGCGRYCVGPEMGLGSHSPQVSSDISPKPPPFCTSWILLSSPSLVSLGYHGGSNCAAFLPVSEIEAGPSWTGLDPHACAWKVRPLRRGGGQTAIKEWEEARREAPGGDLQITLTPADTLRYMQPGPRAEEGQSQIQPWQIGCCQSSPCAGYNPGASCKWSQWLRLTASPCQDSRTRGNEFPS